MKKTYGVPAILSFLLPGLGQMVKGQWLKGFAFLFGYAISIVLFLLLIGFILAPIVLIWNIFDAYNSQVK